jgi:hypothetical protein
MVLWLWLNHVKIVECGSNDATGERVQRKVHQKHLDCQNQNCSC